MAISKSKKKEILDKLKGALKGAKSLVFVNFRGLKVAEANEMRRALKDEGVSYSVAKKTLTKMALADEKYEGSQPDLEGELALAWGEEDELTPLREVYGFQKKFPQGLKILGGVFGGKYMSKGEIEEIALITGIDVLRGKFVNIINSPIQRVAIALNEIAKNKN